MASLVSAGVSVTVTDESFFIPATATTVPLFIIATADHKTQMDGETEAAGTYEHGVVRTVTSVSQSLQLYGVPRFLEDAAGNPMHGDARNEYGLLALNQYLGVGNKAHVVRANVNLNDDLPFLRSMWDNALQSSAYVLENLIVSYLNTYNASNGYIPTDAAYKTTVSSSTLLSLSATALQDVWKMASFANSRISFSTDQTASPLSVYTAGYNSASTGTYAGFAGMVAAWVTDGSGATVATEWTSAEASAMMLEAADAFKFTTSFLNQTRLGANDVARRVAIVTALQSVINSNADIRSESYEYNLILCPGYPELVDEMLNLSIDIKEEAFVIADTPFNMSPEEVVTWAATVNRRTSTNCAYYYPHGIVSNVDGKDVYGAASGIALRTYAYSDDVSDIWFAPAGTRRGLVSGASDVGYITGTLGSATTFVPTALNQGQRDDLYKYFTNINPIVFFPGRGIIIWGQKTSSNAASAMDRVNVVRMVMYIKRQIRKNLMPFVFEPNDQLTRDNVAAVVTGMLSNLIVKRGLYDFGVLCDESNNTPDRIDRNELYVDIAIKPVKSIEFIYVPIRVLNTGASLG